MKEEVKRFLDVRVVSRARAAICRSYAHLAYQRTSDGMFSPVQGRNALIAAGPDAELVEGSLWFGGVVGGTSSRVHRDGPHALL